MIRLLVENMILFLAPTALYLAFALLTRRRDIQPADVLANVPVVTLAVVGAGLVFAILGFFGTAGNGPGGHVYEPAVFKDGKVIPGHMR